MRYIVLALAVTLCCYSLMVPRNAPNAVTARALTALEIAAQDLEDGKPVDQVVAYLHYHVDQIRKAQEQR